MNKFHLISNLHGKNITTWLTLYKMSQMFSLIMKGFNWILILMKKSWHQNSFQFSEQQTCLIDQVDSAVKILELQITSWEIWTNNGPHKVQTWPLQEPKNRHSMDISHTARTKWLSHEFWISSGQKVQKNRLRTHVPLFEALVSKSKCFLCPCLE